MVGCKIAVGYVGGWDVGCEQARRAGERGEFGECAWGVMIFGVGTEGVVGEGESGGDDEWRWDGVVGDWDG